MNTKKVLTAIKIKELTPNGFVEVFELETEVIPEEESERIAESLSTLTDMAMKHDSLFLTTEFGSVVIRGLENKTIKFVAVYTNKHPYQMEKK